FPLSLPGLEHWCDFSRLDLADETPITEAGQFGPKWGQGTVGALPTFRTGPAGINGRGALVFDGDDWMQLPAIDVGNTRLECVEGKPFTLAVVASLAGTGNCTILGAGHTGNLNGTLGLRRLNGQMHVRLLGTNNNN